MFKEFLTTKELCQALKLSKSTIKNYVKQGVIVPAWSTGKAWRWDQVEVVKQLKAWGGGRGKG